MSTASLMHKNGTQLWTEREIRILRDPELTDEDVVELTGRTLSAVRHKRYRDVIGEYADDPKKKAIEGEIRIIKLAKSMNIKLAHNC